MSQRSVVIDGYAFRVNFSSGRVVATAPEGKNSDEDLAIITRLFNEYSREIKTKRSGRWRNGEWRRCSNSECNNAVHLQPYEIESGQASYCSTVCRDRVSRLGWKQQYASRRGTTKKELPSMVIPLGKNSSEQTCYRIGDLVENINPRSDLCGKIGEVVEVETKDGKTVAVKVDFGEGLRVVRVYIAGQNLHFIAPRKKRRQSTPA